ncbi:hypothetical protein SLE2022_029690 [Rubroshorea leprosula]
MGEHGGWAPPPSGLLPNGLLPNEAASVIRVLDSERLQKAEERTAELIACIRPNTPSEERRNAVAEYVRRLVMKCFPCEVFTFGSVPLKTYLPDGDIDLAAFSKSQNLKETWAHQVRDMLENEEKNENAEFRVKEVQYIQAEVKIIKCLVENIVVDISFNQLGGLCTLCFLDKVDDIINQNHLFKRSIILIKAWCYYESRILGAHHGLISTYALETLVLYIFCVFNNSFAGPLEVLYRFLEFFSKFDWDNFCVSLWGPVPISSLPDVKAEHPLKDGGELQLYESILGCSSGYAVFLGGQENQGQPFVSKHFNVIDPLRINNNLGRSVSKGNFFRIRSAFAFGAKRLARLLDCPKEDLFYEVNQFFLNTWERHGSGHRPDAPRNELRCLRLSNPDNQHGSENVRNNSSGKRNDVSSGHGSQADVMHGSHNVPLEYANYNSESTSRMSDNSTASLTESQTGYGKWSKSRTSEQIRQDNSSNQKTQSHKGQRSSKPENLVADVQGRFLFARTRSSPELSETYSEVSSQGRHNRAPESGRAQVTSTRLENNRRKNLETDVTGHGIRSSTDEPSPVSHVSSRQSNDASDSSSQVNTYQDDLVMSAMSEEFPFVGETQGMHQEEQDFINMMASSTAHSFNGQVHFPLNLASGHLPVPIPPVLTSMYAQRNFGGIVPTNVPLIETPLGTNMQFPQGLVSPPLTHCFPDIGLASNTEDSIEPGNENFGSSKMNQGEGENDFWNEQDLRSNTGFDLDNGNFEIFHSDDKQQSTSAGYNSVPATRIGGSGSSGRFQQKFTKETQGSMREDHADNFQYQDNSGNDSYFDDRTTSSRSVPGSHDGSLSKTSSEGSWEGSSAKVSKSARERRGRKTASSGVPSAAYGKGKSLSEHSSQGDDDSRDWNLPLTMGTEMAKRNTGAQPVSLHVPRHQLAGFEPAQTSGSDSLIPVTPVQLGPSSQPFAFLAGPSVTFLPMLQLYNFPTGTGTLDASTSHFSTDEGLGNGDSGQNFDLPEVLDHSEVLSATDSSRVTSVEPSEHKPDILNSDFASHWKNLLHGQSCQNSQYTAPLVYPSPVVVPPVYLQGRFPWDGPGRPLSNNLNPFTHFVSYHPHIVPVAPLQSVSNRPTSVYQWYVDDMPRYWNRSGTGTFLPNPVSVRERHSVSTRRGNYSYDRSDHHGDREGNLNLSSKRRAGGRSHNRSQADKPTSRSDRLAAAESRTDRPWGSHRNDSFPSYQSQNGPVRLNSTHTGSANVAYGRHPVATLNPSGVSSNGPNIPFFVMLYPYDHTTGYGSPAEQLEFGSPGQVSFSGMNETSQLSEGGQSGGVFVEQRFHGGSGQPSSPDQPSSPHLQRGL